MRKDGTTLNHRYSLHIANVYDKRKGTSKKKKVNKKATPVNANEQHGHITRLHILSTSNGGRGPRSLRKKTTCNQFIFVAQNRPTESIHSAYILWNKKLEGVYKNWASIKDAFVGNDSPLEVLEIFFTSDPHIREITSRLKSSAINGFFCIKIFILAKDNGKNKLDA